MTEVENTHQRNVVALQNDIEHLYNERSELQQFVSKFTNSDRRYLQNLHNRRMKEEALVRQFQSNNSECVKIKKFVEEKVRDTLSNVKVLLSLALFCIIESIKENPDKYSPLFYENMPTMTSHYIPNYTHYPWFQEQYQTSYFDMKAMLVEESEKLYNLIAKDLLDEIVSDYHVNRSSPNLPQLPASDKDFPPSQRTSAVRNPM